MTGEVNQSITPPREDPSSPRGNSLVAISLPVELRTNIMTIDKLDSLKDSCSFPPNVQIRRPKEGETLASTRPSEVAFYEATLHPTFVFLFILHLG